MKTLWTHRKIDAPAEEAWRVFTDVDQWPLWGPSVTGAETDDGGPLRLGSTGVVATAVGVRLPFEITAFDVGSHWSWQVAGIPATDHVVEPLGPDSCRVGFGVPAIAAPYLVVCRWALARIDGALT